MQQLTIIEKGKAREGEVPSAETILERVRARAANLRERETRVIWNDNWVGGERTSEISVVDTRQFYF
jgi:hypothetical protein